MVLGLRTKSRKDNGVFVEYLISIKELKPWPTSQVPAQCVLLKWENGENSSGSFIAVVGKDTIMFNESFRLTLTLEPKGGTDNKFQKNLLELNVYDAKKKDKGVKNKLLGSAVVNIAEYGVLTSLVPVGAPFTFKKSSRNDGNSEIYLTIEPAGEDDDDGYRSSCSSQPKMSFSRGSVDKEGSEFSLASLTDDDDDVSSQSSSTRRVSFSAMCDANPTNTETEINGDEKGWKHVTLKHSNNEAALVSEIENLLREEERKRQSNQSVVVSSESNQNHKNDTNAFRLKKQFSAINSAPISLPPDAARKQMKLRTNTLALGRKTLGMEGVPRLKQLKSIQLHFDGKINDDNQKKTSGVSNKLGLITPQESRIETLEDELKESAALEAAVYSVVAEHSSSMSKVHAPARRLARFYLHACKENSSDHSKRACAAKAAVSGLILVSKACGNDVPRLTFWLSNSIVLRAILSRGMEKLNLVSSKTGSYEWEDPRAFLAALEKFESWIFSRVVKSVWWQSMTPYMQSAPVKGSISRKVSGKRRLGHKNQGLYAIELWKNAFRAACERLCPLRGSRQECGCLPMLAKLVMEQLISRLDVAMFNAILRESAGEMPTDPVSDPISDINVLPIPAGNASFGAGAQLKNAIGTWSRWLEDQFEQREDKTGRSKDEDTNNKEKPESENFRLFHLLNSLGDLMMLPFKMLADKSTRKEVCPTLGPPIIKRVLRNFVPDEFNPHRIPRRLFDVLNSEGVTEEDNGCITVFPCAASPTVYLMPSADSIKRFIGELNNPSLSETGSSVYNKQYTSDDELDDLDTSINSIISAPGTTSSSEWMPKGYGRRKTVRYQLLREIWKEDGLQ
ncbi:LOW QUALITY PROTEIN: uncharacterized protein LOC18020587 [Eutrema salsugineum]|uniref:LOW QUALITY PROTEIN: uncharacterized protein LOC18020587 n=1 Tax=Eutrema salsugineum TaxID=72664 RepID=UPI000CED2957|nr:LOW QUALITY PROTEIN: uncharacterized protein LOC18020587 [Eutrema salsugineum]